MKNSKLKKIGHLVSYIVLVVCCFLGITYSLGATDTLFTRDELSEKVSNLEEENSNLLERINTLESDMSKIGNVYDSTPYTPIVVQPATMTDLCYITLEEPGTYILTGETIAIAPTANMERDYTCRINHTWNARDYSTTGDNIRYCRLTEVFYTPSPVTVSLKVWQNFNSGTVIPESCQMWAAKIK